MFFSVCLIVAGIYLWRQKPSSIYKADKRPASAPRLPVRREPPPAPAQVAQTAPEVRNRTPKTLEEMMIVEDPSNMVEVEQHPDFTVYRFGASLANSQVLDLDVDEEENLWIGTEKGLLHFQPNIPRVFLYGHQAGIPGLRINQLAIGDQGIAVDLYTETKPGYATSNGIYLFNSGRKTWSVQYPGSSWDLMWDQGKLWIATSDGVQAVEAEQENRYTAENSGLVHNVIHEMRVHGSTVWFAALGDYVQKTDDFEGGGISMLDRATGRWKSYTPRDGLIRGYCSSIDVDDSEVWVSHWKEESGLSLLDRKTGKWSQVRRSSNGIEVGGVVLAIDGEYVWIGQQRGLVKLNRHTRAARLYLEQDGLPGYIISGIVVKKNAVWVSAYSYGGNHVRSAGIAKFKK